MSIKVGDIVTPDIVYPWSSANKTPQIMPDARLFRVVNIIDKISWCEVEGLYETKGATRVYRIDSLMECNNLYCNKYFDTELSKLK